MSNGDIFGKLEWPSPVHIKPSHENPRNEDFSKDKHFLRLKESVAKYGVIVPIIIKKLPTEEGKIKYQLIDGERRWKAAIATNRDKIPAYVLPPGGHIDILTTMFQIHMNQEGWDTLEQARALEKIVASIKEQIRVACTPDTDVEKELIKQLTVRTGMDQETAESRVRFLRWPQYLRNQIYDKLNRSYYSYAVEIEEKIVEPAFRNFPELKDKFSPDDIRKALFEKVTAGFVDRAEQIRDAGILTKRRRDRNQAAKAKNLLLEFVKDRSFTFSEAREQYISLFPEEMQKPVFSPRKLINTIASLLRALNDYTETTIGALKIKQKRDLAEALKALVKTAKIISQRLK